MNILIPRPPASLTIPIINVSDCKLTRPGNVLEKLSIFILTGMVSGDCGDGGGDRLAELLLERREESRCGLWRVGETIKSVHLSAH